MRHNSELHASSTPVDSGVSAFVPVYIYVPLYSVAIAMARCSKWKWAVLLCGVVIPVAINLMDGITQHWAPNADQETPPKYILFWTPFFDNPTWYVGTGSDIFKSSECKEQRCITTTDKSMLPNSSLVLFHGRNLPGKEGMPNHHDKDQLWLFYTMETPAYTWMNLPGHIEDFDGVFNARGSYMRDSDLYTPYNKVLLRDEDHSLHLSKVLEMVRSKNKLALWFVSNCHTPSCRYEYSTKLGDHLPFDVFGECGSPDPCQGNPQCTLDMRRKYKFYLAFENHRCKDYITEKFFNALQDGMVPIVLGASQADYEAIAPPNSFLHVDNFTSPEELAQYVLQLDKDENAYTRYLLWHRDYEVGYSGDHSLECKLCHLAHNSESLLERTYPAVDLWSEAKLCQSKGTKQKNLKDLQLKKKNKPTKN